MTCPHCEEWDCEVPTPEARELRPSTTGPVLTEEEALAEEYALLLAAEWNAGEDY